MKGASSSQEKGLSEKKKRVKYTNEKMTQYINFSMTAKGSHVRENEVGAQMK